VEDLKINIKFEIDLLCKKLDLKIHEVSHGDTISKRMQPRKEKNPDFNVKVRRWKRKSGGVSGG